MPNRAAGAPQTSADDSHLLLLGESGNIEAPLAFNPSGGFHIYVRTHETKVVVQYFGLERQACRYDAFGLIWLRQF